MSATTPDIPDLRDEKAFEKAFRQYFPALSAYAHRFVTDLDQAEGVVQEVFAQMWEKRGQLELNTSLKSYVYRSVHNRCLNQIRNEKVRALHHQGHGDQRETTAFFDPAILADVKQRVYEALGQLPEQRGKIFRMSRFDGMTYKEIAMELNLSPKTVEAQMGKALKQLRGWLEDVRMIWILIFFTFL